MTYTIAEKKRLAQRARASRQRASLPELVLLLIMLVVNSTPILWGLVTSLKTRREILVYPPKFFNFTPSLEHYFNVFRNGLDIGMRNSLLYSACTLSLIHIYCRPAAVPGSQVARAGTAPRFKR